MGNNSKFLDLYREYETLLREKEIDTKIYEESAEPGVAERVRICRQMRNFLTHSSCPEFLDISDSQIRFLESTVFELKAEKDNVKKHLKTPAAGSCIESDPYADILHKMVKLKIPEIVLRGKGSYRTVSIYEVSSRLLNEKAGKITALKGKPVRMFVSPLTPYADVPKDRVILCTDNGEKDGKLIGILYPQYP